MATDVMAVHSFEQSQIDLIRKQVAPVGTTPDELALFLAYAERTGLDPFSRQIYLSERRANVNGQWVVTRKPEVTIDGFRLIAITTALVLAERPLIQRFPELRKPLLFVNWAIGSVRFGAAARNWGQQ